MRCRQLDDTVLSLLARLRVYDAKLTGERDGATYVLAAADVLYADTADKKTFLILPMASPLMATVFFAHSCSTPANKRLFHALVAICATSVATPNAMPPIP